MHRLRPQGSELTWDAPPPSCVVSYPSAPPAAHAQPRCPLAPTDPTSDPSLADVWLSISLWPVSQLFAIIWNGENIKYIKKHNIKQSKNQRKLNLCPVHSREILYYGYVYYVLLLFRFCIKNMIGLQKTANCKNLN